MKKKTNVKKIIIIVGMIVLALLAILASLIYANNNKSGYTMLEKKWISENKNNTITIKTSNELPIFSYSGEGIVYDYISDLNKDTSLNIELVNIDGSDYEFTTTKTRNSSNVLFYTDHFVVVTKLEDSIDKVSDLKGKNIGVIKDDMADISSYLSDDSGIALKSYENYSALNADLGTKIDYMIIPRLEHLEDILNNNYTICYHFEDLSVYYELIVNPNQKEFNSILKKFFNDWSVKFDEKLNEYTLSFYVDNKSIDELTMESITKKDLIVAYSDNVPYEGKVERTFTGLTNEYLKGFSKMTGATFKYEEFKSTKKLNNALNRDKIDLMFNYNNMSNVNYSSTINLDMPKYVVLSHVENDIVINNTNGLKGQTVSMLKSSDLTSKLKKKNSFTINEYDSVKKLVKKTNNNELIVVDRVVYDTFKTNKFKNFVVKAELDNPAKYNILINKNNAVLNNLFTYYISINSGKELSHRATSNTLDDIKEDTIVGFIINNIMIIVIIGLIIIIVLWKHKKKIKVKKKIKKEDKMMYIDVMTNLKNRNYLNDNMEIWDNNKVYPQSVIVIDVNKIKYINDTEGHEEGDRQIKAVANILINTQRENSEIIRSDGNEFLIYMIGYEEKVVTTYIHKLNKEFKNLPYDYGVNFGYSMINSEIKSLDDAINESLAIIKEQEGK